MSGIIRTYSSNGKYEQIKKFKEFVCMLLNSIDIGTSSSERDRTWFNSLLLEHTKTSEIKLSDKYLSILIMSKKFLRTFIFQTKIKLIAKTECGIRNNLFRIVKLNIINKPLFYTRHVWIN